MQNNELIFRGLKECGEDTINIRPNENNGSEAGSEGTSGAAETLIGGEMRGILRQVTLSLAVPDTFSSYCWPGREFLLTGEDGNYQVERGYFFPLSFLTILYQGSGYTFLMETDFETIGLEKTGTSLKIHLSYAASADTAVIRVYRHKPDWHQGLSIYQKWVKDHCLERSVPDYYTGRFHLKRCFFHSEFCSDHIVDENGNIRLTETWKQADEAAGVDAVLLFDHAYDSGNGIRCGSRDPLRGIPDEEALCKQVEELRKRGVVSLAYFDPYLIEDKSEFSRILPMEEIAVRTKDGSVFRNWAPDEWHPSPASPAWRVQAAYFCSQAVRRMGTDGIYLDELGNGTQYKGYWGPQMKPIDQRAEERSLTDACLADLPESAAVCEFPPVDRMAGKYQAVLNDSASVIDIYRFVFQKKKVFRVIRCDYPLGDDPYAVNKAFFNGEGLWLDNDLMNETWYPKHILRRIRRQYEILKEYADCFDSGDARPLTEGTEGCILVNSFCGKPGKVICAINTGSEEGVLCLPLQKGMRVKNLFTWDVAGDPEAIEETAAQEAAGRTLLKVRIRSHGVYAAFISARLFGDNES